MADKSLCKIEGCDKPVLARGLCKPHYYRWQRDNFIKGKCRVDDCNRPVSARGWCSAHYSRLKRYGDLTFRKKAGNGELHQYYLEVVLPYDGDECLPWPFARDKKGYAMMWHEGRNRGVHQLVCEEENGPRPTPEHDAAHSCGKGHESCVTRGHLSWKTKAENTADKRIHGTMLRGSQIGSSKLTEVDVRKIRTLQGSMTQGAIAEKFGIHIEHVGRIQRRERWAWLE